MYKEKYLKYKNKYIELKKQMGGLVRYYNYNRQIPEFIHNTNDGYQNGTIRNLNSISYAEPSDEEYKTLKKAILHKDNESLMDTNIPFLENFLENLVKGNNILTIVGFYNINKKYDIRENCGKSIPEDCGLDVGTVVKQEDMPRIFNPESQLSTDFIASKGSGKINLNLFCKEIKESGYQYLMLDAAGGAALRSLYERYGFKTLMSPYLTNLFDNEWFPTENSLMIGDVDDIIASTN